MENQWNNLQSGRDKQRKKGIQRRTRGSSGCEDGERKPKFHLHVKNIKDDVLDRFASIRIPGSKKERPHLPHVKHSSSSEWSSSSSSAEFEDLSSKITSEKEILGLFEKMMEDMNLNEDKKAPLREKDLTTKREMVIQYIVTASKTVREAMMPLSLGS
ncbi:protein diaphanous homolog 3-like [Coregonus clupeaformis]|uniref:protein diaphanous homolog 3-like n=1 Tax=Coregonus clupeaformis TaxID=59861 RepID=UPI001E1C4809|nr:protein diaphanous homolog 3-like [Coregonus clupeaformis]